MKAFKSPAGKAATATPEGVRAVVNEVLSRRGKSLAVPYALFQNWLYKHFQPVPDSETVVLMWAAWRECYELTNTVRYGFKPTGLGDVYYLDELEDE